MSGTGFFDSFEPIDTSSESGALNKEPKTATKEQTVSFDLPSGFDEPVPEATTDNLEKIVLPPPKEEEIEKLEKEFGITPPELTPDKDWMHSNNPAWAHIGAARGRASIPTRIPVLCGWAAPPKSGKTGATVNSLTDEEKENGAEIHLHDFDAGGESTKAAHHAGSENIIVLNPWVMEEKPSRVPYNFPATYQRTMDFLKAEIEMADKQLAYFNKHGRMPKPYLKTVIFDGADQWLNICETIMKVDDLGLGPDGISVSGKPHKELLGSGRFNWNIRKNRYLSAIVALQELSRRGVHCYVITHMKKSYDGDGNVIRGAEVPHWLEETEAMLQQVVIGEVVAERDSTGRLTGVVESFATLVENRTSLDAGGRVKIFRRDPAGSEWYGWPGLTDGSFDHPDDVKDEEEPSE